MSDETSESSSRIGLFSIDSINNERFEKQKFIVKLLDMSTDLLELSAALESGEPIDTESVCKLLLNLSSDINTVAVPLLKELIGCDNIKVGYVG